MPGAGRIEWTAALDARLIELRAAGTAWNRIARELGCAEFAAWRRHQALRSGAVAKLTPARPRAETRTALPAGHPLTWTLLTAGTCLQGVPYPHRVFA